MKRFFENETGDTNIVSLIILIIIIVVFIILFKPYISKLLSCIISTLL